MCNTLGAHHMQHVVCYVVLSDKSTIIKFDRVILALFYWLKPLNDEGGRKPEYPEKTPDDELQKMPHTKTRKFKPQPRLEPAFQNWWQTRKADVLTITSRIAHGRSQWCL